MSPELLDFLRFKGITFTSVDKRNDKIVMKRTWEWEVEIPNEYHVDIQELFRLDNKIRTGMAPMAAELLDESYGTMKSNLPKD